MIKLYDRPSCWGADIIDISDDTLKSLYDIMKVLSYHTQVLEESGVKVESEDIGNLVDDYNKIIYTRSLVLFNPQTFDS